MNQFECKPLCELAKTKFCEMDRRLDEKFKSMQIAIDKSEETMNTRLHTMNEFRSQILNERAQYPTRREMLLVAGIVVAILSVIITYVGLK